MRSPTIALVACGFALLLHSHALAGDLSPLETLGKKLFFDTNLSKPVGQSCASCHAPEAGFTGPDSTINKTTGVYPGAAPGRAGNRKPPTVAYLADCPPRSYDAKDETYVGGQFWDGRANDLVEQAKGPFLNPLEMNNASAWEVVRKVQDAEYRSLFDQVYGPAAMKIDATQADRAFHQIAQAIAAYETSREVNPFSSKYDAFLAGRAQLSAAEKRGLDLFAGKANCTACHPHQRGEDGSPPLFTDFTYDNVGVPRNPANPFLRQPAVFNAAGPQYRDLGLGAIVKDAAHDGKVKVPTLRNVSKKPHPEFVKSFLHNGVFKSVHAVVRFYNVRDVTPQVFGPPDVASNVNKEELGKLGLTEAEELDIVAFLETLSDGYDPSPQPTTGGPILQTSGSRFQDARDALRVNRFRQRTAQGDDPTIKR